MHEGVWLTKTYYLQNCSYENLDNFPDCVTGYSSTCAMIVHTWADQLLSQLLMDSLNTLLSHYRHIGNLHEEV